VERNGKDSISGLYETKGHAENTTDSSCCNLSVFIFGLFNEVASRSLLMNNILKGYLRNYTSFHLLRLRKTTKQNLSYIIAEISEKI
jgi:hypothetical protein